ncbi:MAG TPA: hypothetical protein VFX70_19485 [Mycobacteriales bacterium]|nr:hypothetical protein [Mycobacteriales bacterium]
MDARTVWGTWRRVLREPALQHAMFDGPLDDGRAGGLGLTPAEREVVEQYARFPKGTRFFVENYRFRMRSSFLNAVETAAPLTHRLLRAHSVDIDALATRFLDAVEWHDFGPYVYTFGDQILGHLVDQPELAGISGLPELAALERAGIRVIIDAATDGYRGPAEPPPESPADRADQADRAHWAYRANPRAATVHCALDLSAWLRDGTALGRTELPARSRWYLVFLRAPEWERRIVVVPHRAADMMAVLRTPCSAGQLAAAVPELGYPADPELDRRLLDQLARLGAVYRCAGEG